MFIVYRYCGPLLEYAGRLCWVDEAKSTRETACAQFRDKVIKLPRAYLKEQKIPIRERQEALGMVLEHLWDGKQERPGCAEGTYICVVLNELRDEGLISILLTEYISLEVLGRIDGYFTVGTWLESNLRVERFFLTSEVMQGVRRALIQQMILEGEEL